MKSYFGRNKVLIYKLSSIFCIFLIGLFLSIYLYGFKGFLENTKISYVKEIYGPILVQNFRNISGSKLLASLSGYEHNPQGSIVEETSGVSKSIPVLMYHGVVEKEDGTSTVIKKFIEQIKSLKDAGYYAISLSEFEDALSGKKQLMGKPILITFDDGRKDSFYPVDPILKAYDFKATFFIIVGRSIIDKPNDYYLNTDELKSIASNPRWSIGSHSLDAHEYMPIPVLTSSSTVPGYFYSNKLWLPEKNRIETDQEYYQRIQNDFSKSKEILESVLNVKINSFAFPFGEFGQNSLNNKAAINIVPKLAHESYQYLFYQDNPANGFNAAVIGEDKFLIPRIEVRPEYSANDLLTILETNAEKNIPYQNNFSSYDGWLKKWGDITQNENNLKLSNDEFTRQTFIVLNGSRLWRNYYYSITSQMEGLGEVQLVANLKDEKNFDSCSFSNSKISVNTSINGKSKKLYEVKQILKLNEVHKLGIVSDGSILRCILDDSEILRYNIHEESSGAVGVILSSTSTSHLALNEVHVVDSNEVELPKFAKKPLEDKVETTATSSIVINTKNPELNREQVYVLDITNLGNIATSTKNAKAGTWYALPNKLFINDQKLVLQSVYPFTSAMATLQGGNNLKNYKFVANVDLSLSSKVSLVARYVNSSNYISCDFTEAGNRSEIIQIINGKRNYLGGNWFDAKKLIKDDNNRQFDIKVEGNMVICSINGEEVVARSIDTLPSTGSVAVKVYAGTPGLAKVQINNIRINPIFNDIVIK